MSFAKGYDRIANIEEIKSVKLRFPSSNKSLNAVIRNVLKNLGEDIKQYQTPKAKDGTASAGLTLKAEPETWSDILKVDDISKFFGGIKFDSRETKKFYRDTDKQYQIQNGGFRKEGASFFGGQVQQFYNQNNRAITMGDLQTIKSNIDAGRERAKNQKQIRYAPDPARFLTRG